MLAVEIRVCHLGIIQGCYPDLEREDLGKPRHRWNRTWQEMLKTTRRRDSIVSLARRVRPEKKHAFFGK